MNIKDLTLKELVTARFDLVDAILSGEQEGTTKCFVEKDGKGKMKKWTEECHNINGKLISKRVDEYVYSENGDIDTISMKRYDDKEEEISKKIVRHKK